MHTNQVVLAYSGGLDTTYCLIYLNKVLGLEVHAVTINTGAFSEEDIDRLRLRALNAGAKSFWVEDVRNTYYSSCIKYLIFGNVLKNGNYPLSVSSERAVQAMQIAEIAKDMGIRRIAHGSTGAGNDQVRFDMIIHHLYPDAEIITPVRDQKLSRQQELDFISQHGCDDDFVKAEYSINKGLWGTSVGGKETLSSSRSLPESAWPTPLSSNESIDIELGFSNGEPYTLNQKVYDHPVDLITDLQALAQPFGIGRDIHVGDTVIGIKGRVGFEAAAPLIIIQAHRLLEKHVLTKWQIFWKQQLSDWYGNWMHEGQMMDPVMRDIEALLSSSQKTVSGKVFITLMPRQFVLNGISSPHDLMNPAFGSYGEMNLSWSGDDVKGFTKIFGNQTSIYNQVNSVKVEQN